MKFKPIVIFEIVLAILFVSCELLKSAHIPYMTLVAVLSAFILCGLYFYGGFYVLDAPGLKIINPIIYGLAFSMAIVSLVYKFQKMAFFAFIYNYRPCIFYIDRIDTGYSHTNKQKTGATIYERYRHSIFHIISLHDLCAPGKLIKNYVVTPKSKP
jgi:hypothetical protein